MTFERLVLLRIVTGIWLLWFLSIWPHGTWEINLAISTSLQHKLLLFSFFQYDKHQALSKPISSPLSLYFYRITIYQLHDLVRAQVYFKVILLLNLLMTVRMIFNIFCRLMLDCLFCLKTLFFVTAIIYWTVGWGLVWVCAFFGVDFDLAIFLSIKYVWLLVLAKI